MDLSTSGKPSGAEIPPFQVAAFHPRGASACFTVDRGESVAAMTLAFERWMSAQQGIAGALSAGGSGGTALAAPAFRLLPFGTPKLIVSTIASGNASASRAEAGSTPSAENTPGAVQNPPSCNAGPAAQSPKSPPASIQ